MHGLNKIIERNQAAQAAHDALQPTQQDGDFTRELKETVLLYTTTAHPLSAVEQQVLFLARRLLALRSGAAWSEEPLWKLDANL